MFINPLEMLNINSIFRKIQPHNSIEMDRVPIELKEMIGDLLLHSHDVNFTIDCSELYKQSNKKYRTLNYTSEDRFAYRLKADLEKYINKLTEAKLILEEFFSSNKELIQSASPPNSNTQKRIQFVVKSSTKKANIPRLRHSKRRRSFQNVM